MKIIKRRFLLGAVLGRKYCFPILCDDKGRGLNSRVITYIVSESYSAYIMNDKIKLNNPFIKFLNKELKKI